MEKTILQSKKTKKDMRPHTVKTRFQTTPKKTIKPQGSSKTVPGQAISVKELASRLRKGQPVPIQTRRHPSYSDEELNELDLSNYQDVTRLDKMEKIDLAKNVKQTITQKQKDLESIERAKNYNKAMEAKRKLEEENSSKKNTDTK